MLIEYIVVLSYNGYTFCRFAGNIHNVFRVMQTNICKEEFKLKRTKQEIVDRILDLLTELVDDVPAKNENRSQPMEMLTIKEYTEAVRGISEHTIRKLVAQGRVRFFRTGEGERGKILVNKQSLLEYLGVAA